MIEEGIAGQLSVQTLTAAINQQQLNAAQARNAVANACNVLTLGVQLNHIATLRQLTSLSPLAVAAATNLAQAGSAQQVAALQAAHRVPQELI